MTTVNLAALEGDVSYSPPINFREAWASIMACRVKREWAFNRQIPTPNELLRARENKPFSKTSFFNGPTNQPAPEARTSRFHMEEVFCATRRLSEGTYLGLILNSTCTNSYVACFGKFEPCFRDYQLDVSRLICGALAGRLYGMEFCWLKSGGLIVRFGPYLSLSNSKRGELRPGYTVYAFLPSDASMLSAMALCPSEPTDDFVNARFENILLFDNWYRMKVADRSFQSSCVFCGSRGFAVCGCPLPMRRRRMGSAPEMIGYKVRVGMSLWEELRTVKLICAHRGTGLYNVTKAPDSRHAEVLCSGMVPFDVTLQLNVVTSDCLQKHLRLTGQSVNAMRTVYMPFGLKDSGKRQLMPPLPSVDDVPGPITASVLDSKEPKSSLSSSSSRDELISPIGCTRKRARIRDTAAQSTNSLSNTEKNEKAGLSEDVDKVIDATGMVICTIPVVTEVLSSKEKSRIRSAGSRTEGTSQGNVKPQSKIYSCPECGMLIKSRRYNLIRHIQAVHQKERKFECTQPDCEQRFQTKTNLRRHISRVHNAQRSTREQQQRAEQEQEESRKTMQQPPMSDSLFNIDNDVNIEQQKVPNTLLDAYNGANVEQQEKQSSQRATAGRSINL